MPRKNTIVIALTVGGAIIAAIPPIGYLLLSSLGLAIPAFGRLISDQSAIVQYVIGPAVLGALIGLVLGFLLVYKNRHKYHSSV